ncbi:MAG: 50S ribosomal protein L25 [Dehalococcoidia bacterium]|nr:50S ribosomal protein L25 [Dehalococcoidia bacterium]MDW8119822.1 50S ribosomal protein L25 [Chloroflexota bacterium]
MVTGRHLLTLQTQPRQVLGKKVKRLRQEGWTPLHLYGPGVASRPLQARTGEVRKALVQVGRSKPLFVSIQGEEGTHLAFVREIQFHPLTEEVLHVDLYRVDVTQRVEAEVPLVVEGQAPAVTSLGGTLIIPHHTLTVEGLPLEIPEALRVNIASLDSFDKVVRVKDLSLPAGVVVKADPEDVIVLVAPPRVEAVEAPPGAAPAPAEVEVVRPERKAKEEEGEE